MEDDEEKRGMKWQDRWKKQGKKKGREGKVVLSVIYGVWVSRP